ANAQQPDMGMGEKGMGMEPGMGKEPGMGMGEKGMGMEPGMGMGPGQPMAKQPGQSQEKNDTKGTGYRQPDGKLSNEASKLAEQKGDGAFINLPERQRELIRQALSEGLPPEYAGMIQQYYLNLAKTKPSGANPR